MDEWSLRMVPLILSVVYPAFVLDATVVTG